MTAMTSITDELRKYVTNYSLHYCSDYLCSNYLAIADRIDAEHERAIMSTMNDALYHANDESMAEHGWVRLPMDADGVPIRLGDELVDTSDKFHCGKSHIIELKEDGWIVFVGSLGRRPHVYRHVKPDTWESIIYDAMQAGRTEETVDVTPLIERCKELAEKEVS